MKFDTDLPYIREKDFRSIEAVNDFDYIFPDNRRLADVLEDITLVFSSERKQITVSNPTYEKLFNEYERISNALRSIHESEFRSELMNELRPLSEELSNYGSPDDWQYTLLGEYIRNAPGDKPVIVLYIYSIQDRAYPDELLPIVYVHEIMHAYFDHDHTKENIYNKYVEEPITEFAMLNFIMKYDRSLLPYAVEHVQKKQKKPAICFYGLGYYLFNERADMNWINDMYHHKYTEFGTPFLYKYEDTFVKGRYPFDDEYSYSNYLLSILNDYHGMVNRRIHQPVIPSKLRYYMDHIELISILGKIYSKTTSFCNGKCSSISSSLIKTLATPNMQPGYVCCKTVREDVYIPQSTVLNSNMFSDWNVVIKRLNAHIDLRLQGELLPRNHTCSNSYIIVGTFGSQSEALNMVDYLNTKLVRLIVYVNNIKDTVMITPICLKSINSIPYQNFTEHWDDKKLYDKYGLTTEEINYIETVIR